MPPSQAGQQAGMLVYFGVLWCQAAAPAADQAENWESREVAAKEVAATAWKYFKSPPVLFYNADCNIGRGKLHKILKEPERLLNFEN